MSHHEKAGNTLGMATYFVADTLSILHYFALKHRSGHRINQNQRILVEK